MSTSMPYLSNESLHACIVGVEINKATHVHRVYVTDEIAVWLNTGLINKFQRLIKQIEGFDGDAIKIVFLDNNFRLIGALIADAKLNWKIWAGAQLAKINARQAAQFQARLEAGARMAGVHFDASEARHAIVSLPDRSELGPASADA